MEKLFFFSYRFPQEGLWHSYCPTYAHHFCGGSIYVHRKHQNFCSRKVLCGKSIISNCNCLPPKSALYISIVCKADKGGEWNKLSIREYFYTKPISQHQLLIVKTVWLSVDRITLQIFWLLQMYNILVTVSIMLFCLRSVWALWALSLIVKYLVEKIPQWGLYTLAQAWVESPVHRRRSTEER